MEILANKSDALLALFQTTKAERAERVGEIVELVAEGKADPLQVYLQAKCAEEMIGDLIDSSEFKAIVLNEAQKLGKSFEHFNAKWNIKEAGVKYDFSNCGDPVLVELLAKKKVIDEAVKERQKFLQHMPLAGTIITIEDSGETVHVYPPAKSSTTSISITLQ